MLTAAEVHPSSLQITRWSKCTPRVLRVLYKGGTNATHILHYQRFPPPQCACSSPHGDDTPYTECVSTQCMVCRLQRRHAPYTECVSRVIYRIPLSCGRVYIGQTGRCFDDRAREHDLAVSGNKGGHLADHCRRCGCVPLLRQTTFFRKAHTRTERETIEAFLIKMAGDQCISTPSIILSDKEVLFMKDSL